VWVGARWWAGRSARYWTARYGSIDLAPIRHTYNLALRILRRRLRDDPRHTTYNTQYTIHLTARMLQSIHAPHYHHIGIASLHSKSHTS
jgi:hypothetical protein